MKKCFRILLAVVMMLSVSFSAFADEYNARGSVTFDGTELIEGYSDTVETVASAIQPGDTATVTVTLKNDSAKDTNWYMTNTILEAFESGEATGGAYSYVLKVGEETVYDSKLVGGEGTDGLLEIDSLEDTFYICTLKKGEEIDVVLTLGLEGESLVNAYQTKEASLDMGFVVEELHGNTIYKTIVKNTGNESRLWLYETMAVVALTGIGAVLICAKYEKKEEN